MTGLASFVLAVGRAAAPLSCRCTPEESRPGRGRYQWKNELSDAGEVADASWGYPESEKDGQAAGASRRACRAVATVRVPGAVTKTLLRAAQMRSGVGGPAHFFPSDSKVCIAVGQEAALSGTCLF